MMKLLSTDLLEFTVFQRSLPCGFEYFNVIDLEHDFCFKLAISFNHADEQQ